jgi:hypothetical protein
MLELLILKQAIYGLLTNGRQSGKWDLAPRAVNKGKRSYNPHVVTLRQA